MAQDTIRSVFNGRPVNIKLDLKVTARQEKTRKAVLRSDIRTAREMDQANRAQATKSPGALGRKATKITKEFASGKIDMKI